ncbi:hypothetical protein MASR2M47_14950 [Draconibacterium sp.]
MTLLKLIAEEMNKSYLLSSNIYKSTNYNVFIQNRITKPELALSYSIEVIPDLFPEISVRPNNRFFAIDPFLF